MNSNGQAQNGNGRDLRLIEGVLANLALFRQVPRVRVTDLVAHVRAQNVRRGDVVCRRGEPVPGVITFAYGSAKLSLGGGRGEERVLRFLGAGETFGEAAVLHDQRSPVEVVALSDGLVVTIPPLPLLRLLELDARFTRNLLDSVAAKFIGLLSEFDASVRRSALERLAAFLDSLARPDAAVAGRLVARLPATKTAVAARLGVSKETLSRMLRELGHRGLIEVHGREIQILDRARLAQIAP